MFESMYVERVEVQQAPIINLITNPNAAVDLSFATATNATLTRDTGASSFNSPYDTAFKLAGSASDASWMNIGGDTGAIRLGLEKGKTYTVRATARLGGALAGTAGTFRREIVAYTRIGAGSYTTTQSARIANAAGVADLSVTFTVPSNASEAFVRFFHGHPEVGASIWWYKIRLSEGTETDFFDGDTYDGPYFTDKEYGWDNLPGRSTSWKVDRAANAVISDAHIDPDYDTRRVPFIRAIITAPMPDEATIALLNPHRSRPPILNWNIARTDPDGNYESSAPLAYSSDIAGKLWVRKVGVDEITRMIRIEASSGEVVMEDKSNIAEGPFDTNAGDVDDLTDFAVEDAGGHIVYMDPSASATVIPDGDRQLWLAGQSTTQMYEAELGALELRVYGDEVGTYEVRKYDHPPTHNGVNSTLTDGDGGTILEFSRTWDREDWRDATIVKAQYQDGAGDTITDWQWWPTSGANRKGELTQIGRPIPSSNYAMRVTERAQRRAERFRVLANLDFIHKPGRNIDVTVNGNTYELFPEAIQYHPSAGQMLIQGYRV